MTSAPTRPDVLVELRVLEGPNLYFPRAAIKLTLDLTALTSCDSDAARAYASDAGLRTSRPGQPDSSLRQRFAARLVERLLRRIAAGAGTARLGVRVRPTAVPSRVVVAYPWKFRSRARALGEAVADVLEGMSDAELGKLVEEASARVREADQGDAPTTVTPQVPVVAVTGTNGKTTTARMVAHMARAHGLHVGWSSTDGIYVDGELVEAGDYSGPSGAGRVLSYDQVQLAVTETARGGILLRGVGVTNNDVSVVTNVSADHLGLHGIDTLDQLAEVKAVVPRITKASGWAVLNADDPRTYAMRHVTKAPPWVFSRDPESPAIRETVAGEGRATTVLDGALTVLYPGEDPRPLVDLVDVPMTLAGLSRFNVENALAAASAGLAVGLPAEAVVQGLQEFAPGPDLNPGRMNVYSLGEVSVVLDLAHNEAGLAALLEIMRGIAPPGCRLLLALGTAGDRTDDMMTALAELAARDADVVEIVHKSEYLRGRDPAALTELFRTGAANVGVHDVPAHDSELEGLRSLASQAKPGDVVAVMTHQDREALDTWLRSRGATVDDPEALREKVRAAHR